MPLGHSKNSLPWSLSRPITMKTKAFTVWLSCLEECFFSLNLLPFDCFYIYRKLKKFRY